MPEIHPFRGIRYQVDPGELGRVLAPPSDMIPPPRRDRLYARDPRNIVRVVRNRTEGDDRYAAAGATYRGWMAAGLLAAEGRPCLYLLSEQFATPNGTLTRTGLLARFRVEAQQRAGILPH